jgi:hypothetical protein
MGTKDSSVAEYVAKVRSGLKTIPHLVQLLSSVN